MIGLAGVRHFLVAGLPHWRHVRVFAVSTGNQNPITLALLPKVEAHPTCVVKARRGVYWPHNMLWTSGKRCAIRANGPGPPGDIRLTGLEVGADQRSAPFSFCSSG